MTFTINDACNIFFAKTTSIISISNEVMKSITYFENRNAVTVSYNKKY